MRRAAAGRARGVQGRAEALAQLNKLMVRFSPIGMFAIVAHAVGTIELNQLALIQGYLVAYGAATLLLVFWILPACVRSNRRHRPRPRHRHRRPPQARKFRAAPAGTLR